MNKKKYVDILASQLDCVQIPYKREFKFHPNRRWRADFKLDMMILVEVEGLVYHPQERNQSRHTSLSGYTGDCEKYNEAQILGYWILRFTQEHIKSGYALDTIERAIEAKKESRIY